MKVFGYHCSIKRMKPGTILVSRPRRTLCSTENFLEGVRQVEFSQKPSRMSAIFLAPQLSVAKEWCGLLGGGPIYKALAIGNIHEADGEVYTDIDTYLGEIPSLEYARSYWSGEKPFGRLIELVVNGRVQIIGEE